MEDSSGSYSNPTQIATKFNNFFSNVGPFLANEISPSQIAYREFLIGYYSNCFYLNPTSPTEVANIVHYYMAESVFAMRLVNLRSVTCYTDQNFKENAHFGALNLFTLEKKAEIKLQDVYQPLMVSSTMTTNLP